MCIIFTTIICLFQIFNKNQEIYQNLHVLKISKVSYM